MYTVFQSVMWVFRDRTLWPQAFHQKPWDNIPGYRIPVNETDLTP
jgi:hypothetical protein